MVVALNKADLLKAEQVDELIQSVQRFNQPQVILIQATSAKTGESVNPVFETLAHYLIK